MSEITRPTDRDHWLKIRHNYWNASSAATLLHRHPFQTLHGAVEAKLSEDYAGPENDAMRRGRHLEGALADWYSEEIGLQLYEPDVVYVYDDLMMATLDRRVVGNDTDAVEIKTTSKEIHEPERYWVDQCQAQMLCAGLERVHLVAMDRTLRLKTWTVHRDEELIAELIEAARPIMDAIRSGVFPDWISPPPPPRHTDDRVELDPDALVLVHDLAALRADIKAQSEQEERLKRLLGEVLGRAQAGTVDGKDVVVYRSSTRRSIDVSKLRADHPDLAERYMTSSSYRTLRIL